MANSGVLGFTGNQLTEDAWPLVSSHTFNVRKSTKMHTHYRFFGLIYLAHLENLGEEKRIAHLGFSYFTLTKKST